MVGEDQRALDFSIATQVRAETGAVKQIVTEDERALVAGQELLTENERLGQSIRTFLHDVGDLESEL